MPTSPHERREISEAKRRLMELEQADNWLFHGSGAKDIKSLEARQSYNYLDPGEANTRIPDGAPSVSASRLADPAIFMALMSEQNFEGGNIHTRMGEKETDEGVRLNFGVMKGMMERMKADAKGFVYVLPRGGFVPRGSERAMEWISEQDVPTDEVVEVHREDLPDRIEEIE